ncbi:hypothetical protein CAEBREN_32024 [Caenorhabditis brenneri]|uniref:Uncharacterized protein n=1 Tax=Caenorhabditis brenneri TaxID=135651 RepID=G0MVJ7_CAEBE|nr:hypothetical protein CAEBREN_32024 [Caenorhabditis brenneri]
MIYRKVSINSFGVTNSFGYGIGVAICIKLSAVNHSCKPLTRVCFRLVYLLETRPVLFSFFRKRIAILAPVGDRMPATLEGACHSYIDELMPKSMRQSLLKKKYHFDCKCEGCMDDERNALMEAYSCGNCVLGWVRNTEDSRCGACGWQITRDHYELCRTAEESAIAAKPKLYNTTIASATRKHLGERLLELFENTLHDSNVHRMPVLRSLFETSLEERE